MYIWRTKNRRDRRNLKLSGPAVWGPPKNEFLKEGEDDELQYEGEKSHVYYFSQRTRLLMHDYLNTLNGQEEIDLVVKQLDSHERLSALAVKEGVLKDGDGENESKENDIPLIPPEMKKKDNIYQVFRKFDADGSNSIDKEELQVLLKELNVPMKEEELKELMEELDEDGGGGIEFEEFYNWFIREADAQRKKNRWSYFKSAAAGGVFKGFKRLVLEVEARNLIFDLAVQRAEIGARKEYRIAHPPRFVCALCDMSCKNNLVLLAHARDIAFHDENNRKKKNEDEKFANVDAIFVGAKGRYLMANRLLFSKDLLPMEERIKAAVPAPFRPMIADPGSKRVSQLLRGMFVQGADARAGIRPLHRKFGLANQTRVSGRSKHQDTFQDVLVEMACCMDDKIDVICAPAASTHTDVRFQWNGLALSQIMILGEFNAWKPEEMMTDPKIGKSFIIKKLCPGKYRYRYKIDGLETLDETASIIDEPSGKSNIIMVINPKSSKAIGGGQLRGIKHINLRNNILHDDGAWAFASFMHENSSIESIDLSFNGISDEGIKAIGSCLVKSSKLNTLKLNGNGFGIDGCRYLVQSLDNSSMITHIELSQNRLGDDGAEVISGLIKHHTSIRHIFLDSNLIGNDGATSIGKSLENNRTLLSLSLSGNRIFPSGVERLCYYLRSNGTLTDLRLNSNPLGPDGVRFVGEMVEYNDSLTYLDLSDVDMVRNKFVSGLHAVCFSLRKNRSLRTLRLRNNGMDDDKCIDIAFALTVNKCILELDVTANSFDGRWFEPNTFIRTRVMAKMPSLRTSLDINKEIQNDPVLAKKYSVKKKEVFEENDDEFEGGWDHRRRWKKVNRKLEAKKAQQMLGNEEEGKMMVENDYIQEHLSKHISTVEYFINSGAGRKYVSCVSKLIVRHLYELALVEMEDEVHLDDNMVNGLPVSDSPENMENTNPIPASGETGDDQNQSVTAKGRKGSKTRHNSLPIIEPAITKNNNNLNSKRGSAVNNITNDNKFSVADKALVSTGGAKDGFDNNALSSVNEGDTPIETSSSKKKKKKKLPPLVVIDDRFNAANACITAAVFRQLGADTKSMMLHPEKLEQAFQMMGLPLRREDVQIAVDATLIRKAARISHKKFANYIKENSARFAKVNYLQRLRILADLYFHPPVDEAKEIIISHEEFSKRQELIKEFRTLPGKKPRFVCNFCGRRFSSDKMFTKHKEKNGGSDHPRFENAQELFKEQINFLRAAKFILTGSYFPSFYELVSEEQLPDEYFPQIYDNMGGQGRPIGVLEPNMTIRVQDCLGDFLQVSFEGGLGWARHRLGSLQIMRPACSLIKGFSWDGLQALDKPAYYLVGSNPLFDNKALELKVRLTPVLSAEAFGYIHTGQVVEVGAIFGDWLQIRFEKVAAAWVLRKAGGGSIGSPTKNIIPTSPPPPPSLVSKKRSQFDDEEKKPDPDLVTPLLPTVQRRLATFVCRSPYYPNPHDLDVDLEEERIYAQRLLEKANSKNEENGDEWMNPAQDDSDDED